jgi:hypothetical protein
LPPAPAAALAGDRSLPASLKVEGCIIEGRARLRWKPVRRAKAYAIEWLDEARKWQALWSLEGEETAPHQGRFLEYIDEHPGPMGPGGTYRVAAFLDLNLQRELATSTPVVLSPSKPTRPAKGDLRKRLARRKTPARVAALISRLKSSQHGWKMLLPEEAGQCLGRRMEVEVQSPQLTDPIVDLLTVIFENLPRLAARAEKAFDDYGGFAALDAEDQISRPRIVIDETLHQRKSAGAWTIVIDVKGSDYGWHIEFVRSRFKQIWAGD